MESREAARCIAVVIPVRGRVTELGRCLDCLRRQTLARARFEIIVCDDGTPAAAAASLRQLCDAVGARYRRQPPRGPAAARNLGIRAASAPIITFTDSDTLPEPGWLAELLAGFADESVAGVEGPVRPPTARPGPLAEAPHSGGGRFLTANIAYRRAALAAAGGFDERFPLAAFEDVELALRIERLGRIAFAAAAVVIHPWRRTTLRRSLAAVWRFDWLLVVAKRHGCLGWRHRPTRWPRLRVAWSAAVALPAGRFRRGVASIGQCPAGAAARMAVSIVEAAAGLLLAPRWLLGRVPATARRYLEETP